MPNAAAPKRKQTHIPSDFKRRKAKVGKRAVTPANETNVKFKAVTVGVRSQNAVLAQKTSGPLTSGKGKSVAELTHQLSHPAAPVRISACKGLLDTTSQQHATNILESHLSTLLPPILKCALDEDDTVRQLGWACVKTLLTKCKATMKPFLPLLSAFITSGLYSLDRDIRFDASQGVEIVSTILGDMMERDMILKILPSYCTLLSDFGPRKTDTGGEEPSTTPTGKKKLKESKEGKRFQVLASLLSLCKAMNRERQVQEKQGNALTFAQHHAVLLTAPEHHHSLKPIENVSILVSFIDMDTKSIHDTVDSLPNELLNKLRDIYVEVIQRGNEVDSAGMDLLIQDAEEIFMLISIIGRLHRFWENIKNTIYDPLLNIILPAFPIHATSKDHASRYETLNGDICELVMLLSSNEQEKKIIDYLLTSPPSATVVKVLGKVLLSSYTLVEAAPFRSGNRELILERLCECFFQDVPQELARCMAGRRAALLVHDVLACQRFETQTGDKSSEMLTKLPIYLKLWKGDFLDESLIAITTLHEVVRRLDVNDVRCRIVVESLQTGLVPIFACTKKVESIFEGYPEILQRKSLALIVMLQSLNSETLIGLGHSCTRLPRPMVDYVLNVIHMVRRDVSMQLYLNFIITTLNLPKVRKFKASNHDEATLSTLDLQCLLAFDPAILGASRALISCGTSKVLPLVWPVLLSWLAKFCADSEMDLFSRLVYLRVAFNMLAHFSLDLGTISSSLLHVVPDMQSGLTSALSKLFRLHPRKDEGVITGILNDFFTPLFRPVITLLLQETSILHSVFASAKEDIPVINASTIEALLTIVRDPKLSEALRRSVSTIRSLCGDIKVGLIGGHLERLGETLWISLELVVGQV